MSRISTQTIALCLLDKMVAAGTWKATPVGQENHGVVITYSPSFGAIGGTVTPDKLREFAQKSVAPGDVKRLLEQLDRILNETRTNLSLVPFVVHRPDCGESGVGAWNFLEGIKTTKTILN